VVRAAIFSFFFSAVASGVLYSLAPRLRLLDYPNHRRINPQPLANGGGIAIVLGILLSTLFFLDGPGFVSIPLLMILVLGICDDIFELRALYKLIGQLVVAAVAVAGGILIPEVTGPLTGRSLSLGWLAYPATVIWLVAMTNVINFVDGLDGLAGGISLACCLYLYVTFRQLGLMAEGAMVLVMAGALVGFLPFNFPRAKLVLGDAGAMSLGFLLAVLMTRLSGVGAFRPSVLFILLALPILDTAWAIYRRTKRKTPFYLGDREHLHYRLADHLRSGTVASAVLVLMSLGNTGIALGLSHLPAWVSLPVVVFLSYGYTLMAQRLQVIPPLRWGRSGLHK